MSNGIRRGWSEIWRMLDQAFVNVRAPYEYLEASVLDHEYLATMSDHINDMTEDEYHYTLPWLLKDLVTYDTPDPDYNLTREEVIWSMYPMVSDPVVVMVKMRRLNMFDTQQGLAIIAWLREARKRPGLKRIHTDIDDALAFWRDHNKRYPDGDPA